MKNRKGEGEIGCLLIIVVMLLVVPVYGCPNKTDKLHLEDVDHIVELYDNGKKIKSWRSKGRPKRSYGSNIIYFIDSETGDPVNISGTCITHPIK